MINSFETQLESYEKNREYLASIGDQYQQLVTQTFINNSLMLGQIEDRYAKDGSSRSARAC